MPNAPIRVTGAASQIGYSLLFRIAAGEMLGRDQPMILQMLEIPDEKAQKALKGVMMELGRLRLSPAPGHGRRLRAGIPPSMAINHEKVARTAPVASPRAMQSENAAPNPARLPSSSRTNPESTSSRPVARSMRLISSMSPRSSNRVAIVMGSDKTFSVVHYAAKGAARPGVRSRMTF